MRGDTVNELLAEATQVLRSRGVDNPALDARLLMGHLLDLDPPKLILAGPMSLQPEQILFFAELVQQRARRKPLAYIVGKKYFMHWEFMVNEDVLIPRPETELLVETVVQQWQGYSGTCLWVADIGTGSGAVGLSLLKMLPGSQLLAVDACSRALAVARENACRLGVEKRVQFFQGDLLAPLTNWRGKLQAIAANLPYISQDEYNKLQPEIMYEPKAALVSGKDGLEHYRRLLADADEYLAPTGLVAVEIGWNQAEAMGDIFARNGFADWKVVQDLAGLDRVVWSVKKKRA